MSDTAHQQKVYFDTKLLDVSEPYARFRLPILGSGEETGAGLTVSPLAGSLKSVSAPEDADIYALPMYWDYYRQQDRVQEVLAFAASARKAGKRVIIWTQGDFEKIIPIENAIQFQPGLNRSQQRNPHFAFEVPFFVRDYLAIYRNGEMQTRKKADKPRIGFCGQASGRLPGMMVWMAKGLHLRLLEFLNQSNEVTPPFLPPWLLRGKILRLLSQSDLVETDFIIRNRYRAGVRNRAERNDPFHPTNVEFVNNIFNTDYTVCIRGGGNFSKRLYEALTCGRIPVFVDTDSVLPYDFAVDWKQYCVWVDRSEIPYIAEKVAEFHANLSSGDFEALQHKCRAFWQERLSKQGFLQHFHEHLEYAIIQPDKKLVQTHGCSGS